METVRASKALVFWLALTFFIIAASIVPLGSAEETTEPQPQSLFKCLSSLTSVEGCIEAIDKAVHKKFDNMKPDCCKAITELGDNCWPILFPDQPFVPVILKAACKRIAPPPYY